MKIGVMCLQTKELLELQRLEERHGTDISSEPLEETNPANAWFCTYRLQNCKTIRFCCFKPPGLWYFVIATLGKPDTIVFKLLLEYLKMGLIWKDPDAGKDWRWEEKGTTENEMVGWHHRLDGHEFEWTPGVDDGQGALACCSPWGRRVQHDWDTELTETLVGSHAPHGWRLDFPQWWAWGGYWKHLDKNYLEPTGTLGSVIKQRPPTSAAAFPPDPWGLHSQHLLLKDCVCHTQASPSYLMALNPNSPEVLENALFHQMFIEYVPAPCQGLKEEKKQTWSLLSWAQTVSQ